MCINFAWGAQVAVGDICIGFETMVAEKKSNILNLTWGVLAESCNVHSFCLGRPSFGRIFLSGI